MAKVTTNLNLNTVRKFHVSIVIAYADKVSAEHALHGQGILYLAKIACLCSC